MGITLTSDADTYGGALSAPEVPQLDRLNAPSTATGIDDTLLK